MEEPIMPLLQMKVNEEVSTPPEKTEIASNLTDVKTSIEGADAGTLPWIDIEQAITRWMGDWRVGNGDGRDPCPRIKSNGGNMSTITTTTEIDGLKARLKDTWMAGDYDRFSRYMEQGARIFYEQLDVPAGCQLL